MGTIISIICALAAAFLFAYSLYLTKKEGRMPLRLLNLYLASVFLGASAYFTSFEVAGVILIATLLETIIYVTAVKEKEKRKDFYNRNNSGNVHRNRIWSGYFWVAVVWSIICWIGVAGIAHLNFVDVEDYSALNVILGINILICGLLSLKTYTDSQAPRRRMRQAVAIVWLLLCGVLWTMIYIRCFFATCMSAWIGFTVFFLIVAMFMNAEDRGSSSDRNTSMWCKNAYFEWAFWLALTSMGSLGAGICLS